MPVEKLREQPLQSPYVSYDKPLSPVGQFMQLGKAVSSLFSSVCERADQAFQKVVVQKKDREGNWIKDLKTKTQIAQITYIADVKTGDLYKNEKGWLVSEKCFALALGNPFYTLGAMAWHAGKTPFVIASLAKETLAKTAENFQQFKIGEGVFTLLSGCCQVPGELGSALFEFIKAPLFGLGVELAALYGLFKPYRARAIEALIENAWQKGVSYRDDFRKIPKRKGESCWQAFITDVPMRKPFYLAECFQVRGNLAERRVTVLTREPIPR